VAHISKQQTIACFRNVQRHLLMSSGTNMVAKRRCATILIKLFLPARPECAAGSVVQQLAGAPRGEVRARCSVTAPSARDAGPLRFYWTYNGTKDVLPVSID
jgi:hypothetical protein